MRKLVFVSGMFRSGTTMLGRMLDAHPQMTVASDPAIPIFKSFRSAVARKNEMHIPQSDPLDDYYFKPHTVLKHILNESLDIPFEGNIQLLKEEIASHSNPFCPKIRPYLEMLDPTSYKTLISSLQDIIHKAYGRDEDVYTGFKDVWTDECIPAVLQAFPDAKAIQIIRDPRATCASKKARQDNYPWLFLARQWRKIATLSWSYAQDPKLKERVLLIRYEDIVSNPEKAGKIMCTFLGLEYSPDMIDFTKFRDGEGNSWVQNTSHGEGKKGFNTASIDAWKHVLETKEQLLIETLCGPEMRLHGYLESVPDFPREFLYDIPRIPDEQLANWIKKYTKNDEVSIAIEMAKEYVRRQIIQVKDVSHQLRTSYFLIPEIREVLQ